VLCRVLTVMQSGTGYLLTIKSKMAEAAICKNRKITIYLQHFDRLPRTLAWWWKLTFWPFRLLKFLNFKNPRRRQVPSWKIKNRHLSVTV